MMIVVDVCRRRGVEEEQMRRRDTSAVRAVRLIGEFDWNAKWSAGVTRELVSFDDVAIAEDGCSSVRTLVENEFEMERGRRG